MSGFFIIINFKLKYTQTKVKKYFQRYKNTKLELFQISLTIKQVVKTGGSL